MKDKQRCNTCPHHFYTGDICRCYLVRYKQYDDTTKTNAETYKPVEAVTCAECADGREKCREQHHYQPPLLKITPHTCSALLMHPKTSYTVEETKPQP